MEVDGIRQTQDSQERNGLIDGDREDMKRSDCPKQGVEKPIVFKIKICFFVLWFFMVLGFNTES